MATVTRTTTWSDNQTLTASALNGEFNNLLNALNLTNSDISASAGIVFSKLDSATVVGVTASQTLTNKTLTSPVINNPTINGATQGVTALSGTTPTITLGSSSNIFTITLTGSTTYSISGAVAGMVFIVEVKQGSGTTYTNTWFSGVTWVTSGATAPTQTTTSNGYTVYGFRALTASTFLGFLVGTT